LKLRYGKNLGFEILNFKSEILDLKFWNGEFEYEM